jgi:hypothetical protein
VGQLHAAIAGMAHTCKQVPRISHACIASRLAHDTTSDTQLVTQAPQPHPASPCQLTGRRLMVPGRRAGSKASRAGRVFRRLLLSSPSRSPARGTVACALWQCRS